MPSILIFVAIALAVSPTRGALMPMRAPMLLGSHSQVHTFTARVVRTRVEWQRVWMTRVQLPGTRGRTRPRVDFSTTMVIALFAGDSPERTTITIDRIVETRGRLVVYYRINPPPPLVSVPSQPVVEFSPRIATPYAIAGIPRSRLPVVFVRVAPGG